MCLQINSLIRCGVSSRRFKIQMYLLNFSENISFSAVATSKMALDPPQPLLKFYRKIMFLSPYPLHYKTPAPSFKNFDDIPSIPGGLDLSGQNKIFLTVSSIDLESFGSFSLYSCNTALSKYF